MMGQAEKIAELIHAVIEREKPEGEMMSVSNTFGTVEVQVSSSYFDEHFGGKGIEITDHARDYDRHSWQTPSGAKVFCLKAANWERAA